MRKTLFTKSAYYTYVYRVSITISDHNDHVFVRLERYSHIVLPIANICQLSRLTEDDINNPYP